MSRDLLDFVHDVGVGDLPPGVVERAHGCLLDLVAVAAAGTPTSLSRIVRDHAADQMGGQRRPARLLFDGRAVSPPGAAFANASTIDAMDGHDGHRLAKGHAGAAVLPAAHAILDGAPDATAYDLVVALVVGYEVAIRAGIMLHATTSEYHSSGAWNALGAAAAAVRLLALDRAATAEALGIAEYYGPRAPMMRCIEHPTMVKDSSGWGAHAGVTAALLAARGFTGAPASLVRNSVGAPDLWGDLGRVWRITEQYVKPYPVCRWVHPAVEAVLDIVRAHDLRVEDIDHIDVDTFAAATRLSTRHPATSEQAQYSLTFAVAVAAVYRRLDPDLVVAPGTIDERVGWLEDRIRSRSVAAMTALFPAQRRAAVTVHLTDGRALHADPAVAPGDPEARLTPAELTAKFLAYTIPVVGDSRAHALLADLDRLALFPGDPAALRVLLDRLAGPAFPD